MKTQGLLLGLLLLGGTAVSITSCESEEKRLASEMAGVWTGTPDTFTDSQAVTATITDTYCFSPDSALLSGKKYPIGPVEVTSQIQMNTQVLASGDAQEPLSLSASAIASVRGTWTVTDDDEVSLAFDPQTLTVAVDPDQVASAGGMIGTQPSVTIDSMKPQVAANLERDLHTALQTRFSGTRIMEDVKVKGNMLKYEAGDRDFVLTRRM